ncbi:hypothetical protein D3C72_1949290 [compost metagenome]
MEAGIEGEQLIRAALGGGIHALAQHALQLSNQRRVAALRGELGVEPFQRRAHLHHLARDHWRQAGNGCAAARLDHHQALAGQRAQRLAHRDARHAQFGRQLVFHQPFAWRVLPVQDAFTQLVGDKGEQRRVAGTEAQRLGGRGRRWSERHGSAKA